jgi:hypothetical protein
MKHRAWTQVFAWAAISLTASAQEFSLSTKAMSVKEALDCPRNQGRNFGLSIQAAPPSRVKHAPKPASIPVYGEWSYRDHSATSEQTSLPVLFDESKGRFHGYDRMIADLNQNGDLTDDAVWPKLSFRASNSRETAYFGPIKPAGGGGAAYYVGLFVNPDSPLWRNPVQPRQVGWMRIFAANYLETVARVNGVRQKFGVLDGNANGSFADPARLEPLRTPSGRNPFYGWTPGDWFLRDVDGSGAFESAVGQWEYQEFSRLVYFGGQPFVTTLDAGLKSIRFEPYTQALGVLPLNVNVARLVVAEEPGGTALVPEVRDGKALLPPGNYRLGTLTAAAKGPGNKVLISESPAYLGKTFKVEAGVPAVASVPFTLEVKAQKYQSPDGSFLGMLFGSKNSSQSLRMNVVVIGPLGETHAAFLSASGRSFNPPQFVVADAKGKQLTSGRFEFG